MHLYKGETWNLLQIKIRQGSVYCSVVNLYLLKTPGAYHELSELQPSCQPAVKYKERLSHEANQFG